MANGHSGYDDPTMLSGAPMSSHPTISDAETYFTRIMLGYRRSDLDWYIKLNVAGIPAGPLMGSICTAIDSLSGVLYGFTPGNVGKHFKKTCEHYLGISSSAERDYLYRTIRCGFVHDGFPNMRTVVTHEINPVDELNFLVEYENKCKFYAGSLAKLTIAAIDYVNAHRELIVDFPKDPSDYESAVFEEVKKNGGKGSSAAMPDSRENQSTGPYRWAS